MRARPLSCRKLVPSHERYLINDIFPRLSSETRTIFARLLRDGLKVLEFLFVFRTMIILAGNGDLLRKADCSSAPCSLYLSCWNFLILNFEVFL